MSLRLVQLRTVWWPTRAGCVCLVLLLLLPLVGWWFAGEAFLALTDRKPHAEVLVVEGWIGLAGMHAASAEFQRGGYQYVVTTGGLSSARWSERRWSYADMAQRELIRDGVASEQIFVAPSEDSDSQRTQASAAAVWRALASRGVRPTAVNVFTLGVHARRSRLVFAKTRAQAVQVGVVAWTPPEFAVTPWWKSSERARELLLETVNYIVEIVSFGSA